MVSIGRLIWQYLATRRTAGTGDLGYSSTFRGNPLATHPGARAGNVVADGVSYLRTVAVAFPPAFSRRVSGRWPDFAVSGGVVALLAVPNFWLGMMLIALLSVTASLVAELRPDRARLAGDADACALAARLIALVGRLMRGIVIEEQRKDYVRTAIAKGSRDARVLYRHVLRNAMIPIVTVIGLQTGYLLGGSVVVERLFAWPGIGDLLLTGCRLRDYTLVQGVTVFFVVGFLLINLWWNSLPADQSAAAYAPGRAPCGRPNGLLTVALFVFLRSRVGPVSPR